MPIGGTQRLVSLPPAPGSAGAARRFVTEVLGSAGATGFADTAVLLTSELVTNGIVHAHTDMQLLVEATAHWVRVEVVDGSPLLPVRRDYGEDAPTGRGLELVELLADDFGVQALNGDGKRVWFRLGATPGAPVVVDVRGHAGDTAVIALRSLPVALYLAWQQHADAILREATLVAFDRGDGRMPEEFVLAGEALSALAAGTADLISRGGASPTHVDVDVELPSSVVASFPVLRDVLRRCSERSAAGDLLVPPSLPEIQAVRRWLCDEIGRQANRLPPRPWTDPVVDDPLVDQTWAGAVRAVHASTDAQVAADTWNRVIAVSPAAADLLGWTSRDLEGRRLVAIIPPRLRDAHVAGFTRQMLGGTSTILGRPTRVPALRRDGTEVEVMLNIERRSDSLGRTLFLATLIPSGTNGPAPLRHSA